LAMRPALGKLRTSGSSAFAPSAAVSTFVMPCAASTVAATMMMHHVATSEDSMPRKLSHRRRRMNDFVGFAAPSFDQMFFLFLLPPLPTLPEEQYGEIVVPRTPVIIKRNAKLSCTCGRKRGAAGSSSTARSREHGEGIGEQNEREPFQYLCVIFIRHEYLEHQDERGEEEREQGEVEPG